MTRAGIVTVVGKPNAGKSTLLNRIVGQKLAITSPKPQSTRNRIVGIHSTADAQLILFDTPGLLEPRYALQHAMRATALDALNDADVVLYLVDATDEPIVSLVAAAQLTRAPRAPVVLALNKVDLLSPATSARLAEEHTDAQFVSAERGDGVALLFDNLVARLPESPFLYPEDDVSTHQVRFFVAEFVREAALEQLDEEVPYSLACEIEEFREDRAPVYIRAVVYVERESQKRILIGAGGERIRSVGQSARVKIEAFLGTRVYLDLWIKVLKNWRRDARALRRFGFIVPPTQSG